MDLGREFVFLNSFVCDSDFPTVVPEYRELLDLTLKFQSISKIDGQHDR